MIVLHHQRQVAGILVGTYPLTTAAFRLSGVVNELHVLVGGTANALIKYSGGLPQHLCEGVQQGEGDVAQSILPCQQPCFHLGQGGGPLIGADEALPGFTNVRHRQGLGLIHDIELLPQIRPCPGELCPHLVVAAKVGGVDHLHRQFFFKWQGEEAGGERQGLLARRFAQIMAHQIEKAHFAGGLAKLRQHLAACSRGALEGGEIDDRQ